MSIAGNLVRRFGSRLSAIRVLWTKSRFCERTRARSTQCSTLRLESLEDRRMLSVSGLDEGSNQAIEVFHAQDALFAENAGQWDNEGVYYGLQQGWDADLLYGGVD